MEPKCEGKRGLGVGCPASYVATRPRNKGQESPTKDQTLEEARQTKQKDSEKTESASTQLRGRRSKGIIGFLGNSRHIQEEQISPELDRPGVGVWSKQLAAIASPALATNPNFNIGFVDVSSAFASLTPLPQFPRWIRAITSGADRINQH